MANALPVIGWDLPGGDSEAQALLDAHDPDVRAWAHGRLLREARPKQAIARLGHSVIADGLSEMTPYLGAKRMFWQWLVEDWRQRGLVGGDRWR